MPCSEPLALLIHTAPGGHLWECAFFFWVAAWVCPGRGALQSAEQGETKQKYKDTTAITTS